VLAQTPARRLGWTVAVLGALFAGRNASQLGAMAAYGTAGRLADMERAAMLDPGSYRISMLLGYAWRNRGRCDRAREHGARAQRLYPNHPAPKQLLAACGRR
jgi:Flp pilus assembly protein TadD